MDQKDSATSVSLSGSTDARAYPPSGSASAAPGSGFGKALALAVDLDVMWFIAGAAFTMLAGGISLRYPTRTIPYYLDDARLWAPYKSHGTVPFWQVAVVVCVLWPLVVALMEYSASRSLQRSFRFVFALLAAVAMTTGSTEVLKSTSGFLRPDFGQRCLGTNTIFPVADLGTDSSPRAILENADCPALATGGSVKRLRDGRRSFPSGHTSVVVSGSLFVAGYAMFWASLHPARATPLFERVTATRVARVSPGKAIGQVIFIQAVELLVMFVSIGYAGYVSVSRLVDFRHHPVDVAGGALLGLLFSSFFLVRTILISLPDQQSRSDPMGLDWASSNGSATRPAARHH